MTYEQAGDICREMVEDSGIKDQGLAVNAVIRDLLRIAQNETSPLTAVSAIEVLVALCPEEWEHCAAVCHRHTAVRTSMEETQ